MLDRSGQVAGACYHLARRRNAVKFPFAIDEERVSYPPQTFAIYTERIELNPVVDDAVFAMPK